LTAAPSAEASAEEVLQWYRVRWQIELVFQRLKSLLQRGHLPKYDACSSRAWLYGKLLVVLLTQKVARMDSAPSPWGCPLPSASRAQ